MIPAIFTTLAPILIKAGAPLLKRVLDEEVGGAAGKVGSVVIDTIGAALGVEPTPEAIVEAHEKDPAAVEATIRQVEASRDWLLYLASATAARDRLLEREDKRETFFAWGWRPALCWTLIFLFLWSMVILPVVNAIAGASIPIPSTADIMQLGTIWLTVYGIGHTAKYAVDNWGRK